MLLLHCFLFYRYCFYMRNRAFASLSFCLGLLCLAVIVLFNACRKDQLSSDPADRLSFSRDTLRFDTVFTQVGSITRQFKIKNPHDRRIRISSIRLRNGAASQYRLNIDGQSTQNATDVEIAAGDSLYVFVQVKINPTAANAPFIVEDAVETVTNGNVQQVVLEAFGQNANYVGFKAKAWTLTACSGGGETIWDSPKPYVVYGAFVLRGCTLRIKAGVKIYIHGGIVNKNGVFSGAYTDGIIWVQNGGRIIVEGTHDHPVIITTDRLEKEPEHTLEALDFSQTVGQWYGIVLDSSRGNSFNYCEIKNGYFGISVGKGATVRLTNSVIHNMGAGCVVASHADSVTAVNCLFFGGVQTGVNISYGGYARFDYCTMAGYNTNYTPHEKPVLYASNWYCNKTDAIGACIEPLYNDLHASFTNCLIYGSLKDEVSLDKKLAATFDVAFRSSLLRGYSAKLTAATLQNTVLLDSSYNDTKHPMFKDVFKLDYHLDSLSEAVGKANPALVFPPVTTDLDGQQRTKNAAGCYEYKY